MQLKLLFYMRCLWLVVSKKKKKLMKFKKVKSAEADRWIGRSTKSKLLELIRNERIIEWMRNILTKHKQTTKHRSKGITKKTKNKHHFITILNSLTHQYSWTSNRPQRKRRRKRTHAHFTLSPSWFGPFWRKYQHGVSCGVVRIYIHV